jgi:xanthine/uracil permease
VYSTAAYYVAALVAILFGFSPKFGAAVSSVPAGVLGGITVILYGMIGLLGAKIWVENHVNFGAPQNLVPLSAGLIIGIGDVKLVFTEDFQISGIALGTVVVIVLYHVCRWMAPHLRKEEQTPGKAYGGGAGINAGDVYEGSHRVPSNKTEEPDPLA